MNAHEVILHYIGFKDMFNYIIAFGKRISKHAVSLVKRKFLVRHENRRGYFHSYPNGYLDGPYMCDSFSGTYIDNKRYVGEVDQTDIDEGKRFLYNPHTMPSFGYCYFTQKPGRNNRVVCGVLHGKCIYSVSPYEGVYAECLFINGLMEGPCIDYQGKRRYMYTYVRGIKVGEEVIFCDGEKVASNMYDEGGWLHGPSIVYDKGCVSVINTYEHGKRVNREMKINNVNPWNK
jgi:hypothetical protein